MGCNFYLKEEYGHLHPAYDSYAREWDYNNVERTHIGKRSAAGSFCWDCGITLNKGGNEAVHQGTHGWYRECPKCGQLSVKEDLYNSAAGRELGFNTGRPMRKSGVASAASFTWCIEEERLDELKDNMAQTRDKIIVDEYGREYTYTLFAHVLLECPVVFFYPSGGWS